MPKKNKTQYTGFYWFMQSLKPDLKRQKRSMGMQELVSYARPRWKDLTDDEREVFDRLAKEHKKKEQKAAGADEYRLDNQGNIIAHRTDMDAEGMKHRLRDRKIARSRWPTSEEDILDYPFYFISFQYLCEYEDDKWLPCEVSLVEWSMEHGITKTYHKFIDPGGIPLGFRYSCQSHSDDTHKIPIDSFKLADNNHIGTITQIENFINPDGRKAEYPPMYCLHAGDGKEWKMVDSCMSWLHNEARTGHASRLSKIFCLEDMVMDLYVLAGHQVSDSSAITLLTTTAWDYEPNTRCPYHEENEVKYCALGTCKRYAFALSDALKSIFHFELTEKHLPTQDDSGPGYTIIPPAAVHMDSQPIRSRPQPSSGDHRGNNGPYTSRDIRYLQNKDDNDDDSDDYNSQSTVNGTTAAAWGAPPKSVSTPWERSNVPGQMAPSVMSEEEFPSLGVRNTSSREDFPTLAGGDTGARPKYAGRAMAPHPSELPKPVTWQAPGLPRGPSQPIIPQPMTRPATSQAPTQKRTLHEAVEQQVTQPPQQPVRLVRPAMPAGRGIRPPASARVVNSAGFNPIQIQQTKTAHGGSVMRPTLSQSVHGGSVMRPTLSQAVHGGSPGRPTLSQAVHGGSPGPPTLSQAVHGESVMRPTLSQAVHGESPARPTLAQAVQPNKEQSSQPAEVARSGLNRPEPGSYPVGGRGIGTPQPGQYPSPGQDTTAQTQGVHTVLGPPQPLAGLGRGRGRGIYSGVPKMAGGGSGMAAPPGVKRPPPGFGRGMTQQFESLSLENQTLDL